MGVKKFGLLLFLMGCATQQSVVSIQDTNFDSNSVPLQEGIAAYSKIDYIYKKDGKSHFKVSFGEPTVVSVADREYGWGFFQFPGLFISDEGDIVAQWQMASDHAESYGKGGVSYAISEDTGRSWTQTEKEPIGGGVRVNSDEFIRIHTPESIPITNLQLPKPIATVRENYGRTLRYWKVEQLPSELRGVYLQRRTTGSNNWVVEHNEVFEPNMVRYSDNDVFPVVWWGSMKLRDDGLVIAGIYPGFTWANGSVPTSDVPFYISHNGGRSWSLIGRIPYCYDPIKDPSGGKRTAFGYTEPTFEVLQDGSYLCVMRTTDGLGNSPMYISRSVDQGKNWDKPVAFTKNGVLPKLRQLANGVLVLASGRPGLQLRIALDEQGSEWSDPFEMLPWVDGVHENNLSCGYPDILPTGQDKFLLIYSDFRYKTASGELRKAIKTREISIKRLL